MALIYPSLLAADGADLNTVVAQLEPYCPGFHIDIMDNKFVPNMGIDISTTNELAKKTFRKLWIHLMVQEPEDYLKQLQLPEGSIITFHIESHKATSKTIKHIIEKKWLPSIAVNPKTGIGEVFPFLGSIYSVLIMSVEPGFAGQPFIPGVLAKIDPLIGLRTTNKMNFKIALDGGINVGNIALLAQKGVEELAVGSALFDAKAGAVEALKMCTKLAEESFTSEQ